MKNSQKCSETQKTLLKFQPIKSAFEENAVMVTIVSEAFGIVCDWLVGCFGFNGPLRQYCSLYRPSPKEREKEERKER